MVDDGVVDLAADPPAQLALELALDAAQSVAQGARPGSHLLAWIGEWSDTPLRWTPGVTQQLFAVLTDGDVRAWRFLETTGVLERALPELAEAVDRRRNDPFLLDPSQVLRFTLVERIREIVATDPAAAAEHAKLQHPEWLLLAALILDTVGEDSPVAARTAHRTPARSRRRRGAADRARSWRIRTCCVLRPGRSTGSKKSASCPSPSTSTTRSGPVRSIC